MKTSAKEVDIRDRGTNSEERTYISQLDPVDISKEGAHIRSVVSKITRGRRHDIVTVRTIHCIVSGPPGAPHGQIRTTCTERDFRVRSGSGLQPYAEVDLNWSARGRRRYRLVQM